MTNRDLQKDILQLQIEQSHVTGKAEQMAPRLIAHRLIIFSFSIIDAISITLSHVPLDLYSTPPSEGYVETLRQECDTVMKGTPEGCWTKDAVSQLVLLDSTIRESMRCSDFGWTAYQRRVSTQFSRPFSPPRYEIPHFKHIFSSSLRSPPPMASPYPPP